jgi:hypothetical protein
MSGEKARRHDRGGPGGGDRHPPVSIPGRGRRHDGIAGCDETELAGDGVGLEEEMRAGGVEGLGKSPSDLGRRAVLAGEAQPAYEDPTRIVSSDGDPQEGVGAGLEEEIVDGGIGGRRREARARSAGLGEERADPGAVGGPRRESRIEPEGAAELEARQLELTALHPARRQRHLDLGEVGRRDDRGDAGEEPVPEASPDLGRFSEPHLELEAPGRLLEGLGLGIAARFGGEGVGGSDPDARFGEPPFEDPGRRRIVALWQEEEEERRPFPLRFRGRLGGMGTGRHNHRPQDGEAPPRGRDTGPAAGRASTATGRPHRARCSSGPGRGQTGRRPRRLAGGLALAVAVVFGGCFTDVGIFTAGRTEDLCNAAIPICRQHAGCALDDRNFVSGRFPGELRIIAHSETGRGNLVVRLLLLEATWPGTELLVQAYAPGCGDVKGEHLLDVDFFELAGNDRTLTFLIPLEAAGDHLVEVFSDMAAEYLMTVDVEDRP